MVKTDFSIQKKEKKNETQNPFFVKMVYLYSNSIREPKYFVP